MGDVPSKQITQWHKTTGPIYKLNMGNQLWIMISDPFLAHDIFVKAGSSTSSRPYHRFTTDLYNMNDKYSFFYTVHNKILKCSNLEDLSLRHIIINGRAREKQVKVEEKMMSDGIFTYFLLFQPLPC